VDRLGREVSGAELKQMFWREYVERQSPRWGFQSFASFHNKDRIVSCDVELLHESEVRRFTGSGNGPLAALVHGFGTIGVHFEITNYSEHALGIGETAAAIAYIQVKTADGKFRWGAGVDTNIELASVKAVLSALNRL